MENHVVVGANAGGLLIRAMVKTICSIGVVVCDIHINSPFLNFNLKMGAGLFQPRLFQHPFIVFHYEMSFNESQHMRMDAVRGEDLIQAKSVQHERYDLVVVVANDDCGHCVIPDAPLGSAENGFEIIGLNDFR